jgi:hypothetical protein
MLGGERDDVRLGTIASQRGAGSLRIPGGPSSPQASRHFLHLTVFFWNVITMSVNLRSILAVRR